MTDWLILFSNIAAGGVRAVVYLFLVFRLLSVRKPGRNGVIAVLAGITVISVVFSITELPDIYRMILETVWIVVCARHFQNADTRMCFFIGIFFEIANSFWLFLIAAWLGILCHSPAFLDYDTGSGQIAVWLLLALLILVMLYLWKNPGMDQKGIFRFLSACVVAGFLAVVTLSQQTSLTIADDMLDMWTILAVILMMSVLVFNMSRQYEAEKELAELKSEQNELLERDYTTLNNAYEINAKLFHDFHNHIGVLHQLLSHKKLDEAMQYLDELQIPLQEMTDTVWTNDDTIDYLINSKAAAAKERGIQYQVQVEFPQHTNLRSADLCAILGNLLDNALEAAGQIPENKKRFINLTIRRINQMLIIKVENSFTTPPSIAGGEIKNNFSESQ